MGGDGEMNLNHFVTSSDEIVRCGTTGIDCGSFLL